MTVNTLVCTGVTSSAGIVLQAETLPRTQTRKQKHPQPDHDQGTDATDVRGADGTEPAPGSNARDDATAEPAAAEGLNLIAAIARDIRCVS